MKIRTLIAALLAIAGLAACQKPSYHMALSDKTLTVSADGGVVTFDINANVYYRVNNDIEWADLETVATNGESTTFQLTVQPNPKTEVRRSTVRFIGDHVTPLKFELVQEAKVPVGVSVSSINVNFNETSAEFTILGTKPWTASSSNPDFTLSATSGNGETDVKVTFPENEKTQEVKAVITVVIAGESYTVEITQAAAPSKERIDLSAEKSANCYLVSKGGYYKFKATVRGNGVVPESFASEIQAAIAPAKVAVLWSTFNTNVAPASQNDIICEVGLEDGYVVFQTSDMANITSGNVIIAAYDASDAIIWTWHIWVTDEPAVSEIGGAMWMDRNLGATSAARGDARSCGLYYQWGRKDPMRGASSFEDGDFIATLPEPQKDEVEVAVSETTGTLSASIANPRAFINTFPGGAGPKDWIFTADHPDRWQDAVKTMLDPCPAGYKVPSEDQMVEFISAGGIPTGSVKYSGNATAKAAYMPADHVFETTAYTLPLAGMISYNDGTMLTDVNVAARLETSSDAPSKAASSYYFNANGSACNSANIATRGHAAPARCVKEK